MQLQGYSTLAEMLDWGTISLSSSGRVIYVVPMNAEMIVLSVLRICDGRESS